MTLLVLALAYMVGVWIGGVLARAGTVRVKPPHDRTKQDR
jgi:hypothetical protein